MSLSDPNLIIEAALRNDERRGLPPRYSTASITPISGPRPTVQGKIETLIFQQAEARKAYFAALADRDDLVVRMARRNLRDVDTAAIDCAQIMVAHTEKQWATINEQLLEAHDTLDCTLFEDFGSALSDRLGVLTAPIGNGDDSAQHLGFADYGLSAGRRA